VNLNVATEDELQQLDGVTKANAKVIVAWRRGKGPFKSIADLDRVPGLPPKVLETVQYFVTARFDADLVSSAQLVASGVPSTAADALIAARRKKGHLLVATELDRVAGLSADERELLRVLLWFQKER
jgi:competence ComEA-like helix-hairpin-helix protein